MKIQREKKKHRTYVIVLGLTLRGTDTRKVRTRRTF